MGSRGICRIFGEALWPMCAGLRRERRYGLPGAYREKPNIALQVDVKDALSDVFSVDLKGGEKLQIEQVFGGGTGYLWKV